MNDSFDAFSQGVTLGGLRNQNDIKILLCYILKSLGMKMSKSGLVEILQSAQLVNFFEINNALSAISEAGLVTSEKTEDDEYFSLTEDGFSVADKLDTELPLLVRDLAVKAAVGVVAREKMKGSIETEIKKLEKGYNVVLSIKDGDTVMMQTVLYAADGLQAQSVEESFLKNPEKLYSVIIDALIG